jgi:hypothetical protein
VSTLTKEKRMSLTQNQMVYLGILEDAANVAVRAFFTSRSRYLHLSSLAPTSPTVTNVGQIPFLGHWKLDATMPEMDFFAPNQNWPPGALTFTVDEFGLRIDPAQLWVSGPVFPLIIKITGSVALIGTSGNYALQFALGGTEVLNAQGGSAPALLLSLMTGALQSFLAPLSPVTLPLPPIAIGPIVPAVAPIINNHEFALRGAM